ncbi:unnamed protein product [Owenia fusiformis]|uniref:Uncharacterized protein n=1 Tax=Owenia fusiformis TaxID=6347 RepID=A0A8J1TTK7_OWEFU|nr:unnamed protein product [Owenia fusiformis]
MAGKHAPKSKKKPKAGKKKQESGDSSANTTQKYTVDQLLDKVAEYLDEFKYELAQKFCQRAVELEPDNLRALELSGQLLLEVGNNESAKHCFGRAVELSPDNGHSKYMYLGQLCEGVDAVTFFQKGIALMEESLLEQQNKEVNAACALPSDGVSVKDISSAYCSVAELYMTDLCDEADAEVQCRTALERAIERDATYAEAFHLMASFQLIKQNKNEAKKMIDQGVKLWLPKLQSIDKSETLASEDEKEIDPLQVVDISYGSRVEAAKILIEVEDYKTANEVLEYLLDEDDTSVQVWYLLGLQNYLEGADYKANARYYLTKATTLYTKKKKEGTDTEEDLEILGHVEKLLTELGPGETEGEDEEEDAGNRGTVEDDIDFETDSDEEPMDH